MTLLNWVAPRPLMSLLDLDVAIPQSVLDVLAIPDYPDALIPGIHLNDDGSHLVTEAWEVVAEDPNSIMAFEQSVALPFGVRTLNNMTRLMNLVDEPLSAVEFLEYAAPTYISTGYMLSQHSQVFLASKVLRLRHLLNTETPQFDGQTTLIKFMVNPLGMLATYYGHDPQTIVDAAFQYNRNVALVTAVKQNPEASVVRFTAPNITH